MAAARFEAARVLTLDVDRPLPPLTLATAGGRWHGRALLLVRYGGRPVGTTDVDIGTGLGPVEVAARVWAALGPVLAARVTAEGGPAPSGLPPSGLPPPPARPHDRRPVTVAIATRDRTTSLARCLHSVLALDPPAAEVVVVDSAPSDDRTATLVGALAARHGGIRYRREPRPGLARAHNVAVAAAEGELLAFTDDDVVVDPGWIRFLAEGFAAADDVACVTGMISPAEIESPAQAWLEAHVGFGKGFRRRIVDPHRTDDRLLPFTAGRLGSGANMAFTRAALEEMGGFDEALGAGTPARGGDDLAAFYDVLRHGHRLVYEPAAIVHHHHHVDSAAVRRLTYGYGVALAAYLTRAVVQRPAALIEMAARLPGGLQHGLRATRGPTGPAAPGLDRAGWRQRAGMLAGPWSYARSRRHARATVSGGGAARSGKP